MAEILYRMCVCAFKMDPCTKFNGPKIWDPVRTKKGRVTGRWKNCLSQGCKTLQATQHEKNSSEVNLSFVLLWLKFSFCGTWLGLMFVLVDLLFCRKVKIYT